MGLSEFSLLAKHWFWHSWNSMRLWYLNICTDGQKVANTHIWDSISLAQVFALFVNFFAISLCLSRIVAFWVWVNAYWFLLKEVLWKKLKLFARRLLWPFCCWLWPSNSAILCLLWSDSALLEWPEEEYKITHLPLWNSNISAVWLLVNRCENTYICSFYRLDEFASSTITTLVFGSVFNTFANGYTNLCLSDRLLRREEALFESGGKASA